MPDLNETHPYTLSLQPWYRQFDIQKEITAWMDKNTPDWLIKDINEGILDEYKSYYVFFKNENDLLMFNLAWKGSHAR